MSNYIFKWKYSLRQAITYDVLTYGKIKRNKNTLRRQNKDHPLGQIILGPEYSYNPCLFVTLDPRTIFTV